MVVVVFVNLINNNNSVVSCHFLHRIMLLTLGSYRNDVTYPATMTTLTRYYDVTNPATMTSLTRYYDVTNPATMTSSDCIEMPGPNDVTNPLL